MLRHLARKRARFGWPESREVPGIPGSPPVPDPGHGACTAGEVMPFSLPRPRAFVLAALFALTASLSSSSPQAAPASRNVERFDVKVPNSSQDAGAARVLAHAPT